MRRVVWLRRVRLVRALGTRWKLARLAVSIAGFAAIGAVLIFASQAATGIGGAEAEDGLLEGNVAVIDDSSASGGRSVRFGPLATPPFPLWVEPSIVRVSATDTPKTRTASHLQAAKGEYESFQIAMRASGQALTNVNVTAVDLRTTSGQVLPKSNITLYREHFANISPSSPDWAGSSRPGPAGLYADALIPFAHPTTGADLTGVLDAAPFGVSTSKNEVIWVDVFVPRTAVAGTYTGTITVSSSAGNATVPVSLKVWDFTLPVSPSEKSAFLFWEAGSKANEEELLRHKLMPSRLSTLADEPDLASRLGLSAANAGFWSGADISNCTMESAPSVAEFQTEAARHASGVRLYNYTADEISDGCASQLSATLKQWARNMHQAGIDNLVTMPPNPAFYDDGQGTGRSAVDIWTILPYQHNAGNIQTVINKGDEVWSYNALVQDEYSPKWLIDFAPIQPRIQAGFINASLGYTGLLYWRVDYWRGDPWNDPNMAGIWSSSNYPGDGLLVYPGDKIGMPGLIAPSMRLKQLRDGVEDYEYVQQLKHNGQSTYALQVSRSVGADWSNWTQDPAALMAARNQLGEKLHDL